MGPGSAGERTTRRALAAPTAGPAVQHEREQPERFRLPRQQPDQHTTQEDRLLGQIVGPGVGPRDGVPARSIRRVDRVQHVVEPLGQLGRRGQIREQRRRAGQELGRSPARTAGGGLFEQLGELRVPAQERERALQRSERGAVARRKLQGPPAEPLQQVASVRIASAPPAAIAPAAKRIWVQLASGLDERALGGQFAKLAARKPELFEGIRPFVAEVDGRTKLLVGPFKDRENSEIFLDELAADGISSFSWTSPEGQPVRKLVSQ